MERDPARPRVRWIVFDVGETLVNETRMWHEWADILGVPRFTFSAALGAVIGQGEDHRRVFDIVAPGVDWRAAGAARPDLPRPSRIEPEDLYPDVIDSLSALRRAGFRVGIAGNQPVSSEVTLARIGVPFDLVGSSEGYGASKPDPRFFAELLVATGGPAHEVAYVGDRYENDVEPALAAGLRGVLLRRGPWATIGLAVRPPDAGVPVVERIADLGGLFEPLPATGRATGLDPGAGRRG